MRRRRRRIRRRSSRKAHRRDVAVVLAERRDAPQRHEPVVCKRGRGFDLLPPAALGGERG